MLKWNDLTEDEKKETVQDFKACFEVELNIRKRWLEKVMQAHPDKVADFVFINGRLPQMEELEL